MKYVINIVLWFFLSASCNANQLDKNNEITINNPEDLNVVCKNKSLKYFEEKNKSPYNWESQWRVDENIIDVKGFWTVEGTRYIVLCRIKQGLNEALTTISIEENKN